MAQAFTGAGGAGSKLEVSGGERSRMSEFGRAGGFGLLTGAGVGGMLGFADGDDDCGEAGFCILEMFVGEKALFAGVLIGGLRGAIGGLVGMAKPEERWQRVPLRRVVVAPSPGGLAAAMSLAF